MNTMQLRGQTKLIFGSAGALIGCTIGFFTGVMLFSIPSIYIQLGYVVSIAVNLGVFSSFSKVAAERSNGRFILVSLLPAAIGGFAISGVLKLFSLL